MLVRDIVKEACDSGRLDDTWDEYGLSHRLSARGYLATAVERTESELGRDRWKTVVIPVEGELIAMFRSTFLEGYTPSCRDELEKMQGEMSFEERRFTRCKVAPKLLMAHHQLLSGPRFGSGSYRLLLAAEVPEPFETDPVEFTKAFITRFGGIPTVAREGEMDIRVVDPISQAIARERAFAKAHAYFMANGPMYGRDTVEMLRRLISEPGGAPILVRSDEWAINDRVMHDLIGFLMVEEGYVGRIKASQLNDLSDNHLRALCQNRVLVVSGFVSLLLDKKGEEAVEKLLGEGVRLVLFSGPGEEPVFTSDELDRYFASVHKVDINGEEEV